MIRVAKVGALFTGVGASLLLGGCTPSQPPGPTTTVTSTQTITRSASGIPTTPVVAGPTTSRTQDCPLVSLSVVMPIIGQRLDHATTQTSGGKTVGCEFFPITTGSLAVSEKLPTHGFPSIRITVTTYPSAESARQVLALTARAGELPSLQSIGGLVGETFQTRFYPPDGTSDWACAFIKGPKLVEVHVAESTSEGQTNALEVANTLSAHV